MFYAQSNSIRSIFVIISLWVSMGIRHLDNLKTD